MLSHEKWGFVSLVLLIISMAGCVVSAENVSFLTYNDTRAGFSFSYPEGATLVYVVDAETSELSVLTPENITMMKITTGTTDESLENLTSSLSGSVSLLPDIVLDESHQGTLGGENASIIEYQWTRNGTPVRTFVIMTVKDGILYTISNDNVVDSYESDKSLIDQMINSLTFQPRDTSEKYSYGTYYPTVYDYFGQPISGDTWNPYNLYGWDGSTGYTLPSYGYDQFPSYTGYDPYSYYNSGQYPQTVTTEMPTIVPFSSSTFSITPVPTVCSSSQSYGSYGQETQVDVSDLINEGLDYLSKNQYKKAEEAFKKALEIDPSDFRAHYGYAKVLYFGYEGKADEEAYKEIELAISGGQSQATSSQLALLYQLKSLIEMDLSMYDEALDSIEYAISHTDTDTTLAYYYWVKARILSRAGASLEEVIEAAQQAVSLDPNDTDYQNYLAELTGGSGSTPSPSSHSASGSSVYPSATPVKVSS